MLGQNAAMKLFKDLPALLQALPDLAANDWVDLPSQIAQQIAEHLGAAGQPDFADVLSQPALRCVVRGADDERRMGYAPWLPVALLRELPWPLEHAWGSAAWRQMLQAEFDCQSQMELPQTVWADAQVPQPYWPVAGATDEERLAYWLLGLQAHAWMDEEPAELQPISPVQLRLCEWRLGCKLPDALRRYHLHLGVLDWAERLLNPRFDLAAPDEDMDAIGPVSVVFPGVADIVEMQGPEQAPQLQAELEQMVAFGDYLGNGNLWCFDRRDGSVWYLDHDNSPLLTRVFDDVGDYLDALTVMSMCRAYSVAAGKGDGDELAEAMLIERYGKALVRKWMY